MTLSVLVVDDDRDVAESLGMVLEELNCQVDLAHSGEQAIARWGDRCYDLTLMDLRLPGRNGVEVFDLIRGFKPDARVVFVTGYGSSELIEQAVSRGALGVLDKPVDIEELRNILTETAARQRDGGPPDSIADRK